MNLVSFAGEKTRPKVHISPVKELEMVMAKGGEGIDKAIILGKNVGRTADMIVAPMVPGEKLFQVPHGRYESYRTCAQHAATQILRAYSPNDVSRQQPALFADGTRRPAMTDTPFEECKKFADNFILSTPHDSTIIYDFFQLFGLSTHGDAPTAKRISVKGSPTDKAGNKKVKIATANIPAEDIDFILMVEAFGRIYDPEEPSTLVEWVQKKCTHHQERLQMSWVGTAKAVEMIHKKQICFLEVDQTMDLPGTIHMREFIDILKAAGHTVSEDSRCGSQCTKFTMIDFPDVIFKVYNKVLRVIHLVRFYVNAST